MTESTTSSPHDAVFKTFMFTPETARDFLEIHLPEPLRKLCNLQTLRLEPTSFIEKSLRAYYSDVLWSVETSDGDGAIAYAPSADIAVDDAMWESDATRITNGKQLMSTTGMHSFDSYIWNVYAIRDKITFTGYPTEDGSGSSFELQMPMAISSVTKYPDAAWDFVCSIIKKMNTIDENNYYYGFPISQAAFDAEMTDIMTEQYQLDENGEQVDWDGDGEPDKVIRGGYETMENGERVYKDVYALTQEDIDQILGVINSTRSVYDYDQEILDIITDEVAAYFAGDKDVQTTANMIQSRVNLYVQEQR